MNKVADEITLSLLVHIEAKGGRYQSSCPAINVASAGRTIDEALTNIHEAVEQRLENWVEEGQIFDKLERHRVPFVEGRRTDLPSQADIPPGVLAATLNQYVRVG
jgi:predicted RNase H-like HicB family nuclease